MARVAFGTVLVAVLVAGAWPGGAQPICRENELGQTICAIAPPLPRDPRRSDERGTIGLPATGPAPAGPTLIPSQRTNNLGQTFPRPGDVRGTASRTTCRRDNLGHLRCQ